MTRPRLFSLSTSLFTDLFRFPDFPEKNATSCDSAIYERWHPNQWRRLHRARRGGRAPTFRNGWARGRATRVEQETKN